MGGLSGGDISTVDVSFRVSMEEAEATVFARTVTASPGTTLALYCRVAVTLAAGHL